jgi:hypothetical protein
VPELPDPATFNLAIVLTLAGGVVSAGIIAGIIEVLKKVPGIGPWIDAKREPAVAFGLSFVLVAYAYAVTTTAPDFLNGFGAFLAWLALARLAMASYDVASAKSLIA